MRYRSSLAVLALAVLLVTAGCSGAFADSNSPDGSPSGAAADAGGSAGTPGAASGASDATRTIEVAGTGQVETQPDQVVVRVAVTATGENASIVRERLAENASSMRSALRRSGIGSGQIATTDYDITNTRRYGPREADEPPFRGQHSFAITLTEDVNGTGSVIVTAVENGATDVDDVRFTLSESKRRELHREALADAMSNAREQADVVAASADLSIAGVGTVRTADVGFRPVRYETAALAGGGGGGGTQIEGGTVTVTADVRVVYNATAA